MRVNERKRQMNKQQVAEKFEQAGVKVLRIVKFGQTFKVTINWRDYLKIRGNHDFNGYELVMR